MMKKNTNLRFLFLLVLFGTILFSCVQDDDFETPTIIFDEPNVTVNSSISSIKQIYGQYDDTPILIEGDSLVLAAYVISSDKTGNFYKELILQDAPENPESGIKISTEASDLYTLFEPGRKVYVLLDGLYIGEDLGGTITLGALYQGQIGRMSKEDFEAHVLRSGEVAKLIPTPITLNEVVDAKINTLIKFENMQFSREFMGESYGNIDNTYNVDRPIMSCETGQTISMRNSGYATFKNQLLPEGKGEITAVLGKYNTEFQIMIRNTADVALTQPPCDPEDSNENLVQLPYNEGFEEAVSEEYLDLPGWTNVNLSGGSEKYSVAAFDTNQYVEISAYGSDEDPLVAWLVTPGIDLTDAQGSVHLNFETKDGYYNGEGLSVYISTDFSDSIENATWTELSTNISSGSTGGYADYFTPSGNIDISNYNGNIVHIGFKYVGADSDDGVTTSYQIDTIEVLED